MIHTAADRTKTEPLIPTTMQFKMRRNRDLEPETPLALHVSDSNKRNRNGMMPFRRRVSEMLAGIAAIYAILPAYRIVGCS